MAVELFQFRSLREPPPQPQAVPEIPREPTFGLADIESAQQEGYQKGYMAGHSAGMQQAQGENTLLNQSLLTLLGRVEEKITQFVEAERQWVVQCNSLLPRLAVGVARKVAGAAMREAPTAEIERMVADCVSLLAGQAKLTVCVNPALAERLQERLQPLLAGKGYEGTLLVKSEPALAQEDCRLEWGHGQAERRLDTLWQDIEARLAGWKLGASPSAAHAAFDSYNQQQAD